MSRPENYVKFDLDGLMRVSGLHISGDVIGPGCSHFDLVRDDDEPVG